MYRRAGTLSGIMSVEFLVVLKVCAICESVGSVSGGGTTCLEASWMCLLMVFCASFCGSV